MRAVARIAASLVVLGCCLAPAALPAAEPGAETVVVAPTVTEDGGPTTTTEFVDGKRYQAVLSGTVSMKDAQGVTRSYDPIYCYAGPGCGEKDGCCGMLQGKDGTLPGYVSIMAFGRPTTPSKASPGNPAYRSDHTYTIVIDQARGALQLAAPPWGTPVNGQTATGQFSVAITPIDAVAHTCVARVMKAPSHNGFSLRLTQSSTHSVSAMRLVASVGRDVSDRGKEYDTFRVDHAKGRLCHKDLLEAGDETVTLAVVDAPANEIDDYPRGLQLRVAVKVTGTDDPDCAVGTPGVATVWDGQGRPGGDYLQLEMGPGCSGHSHDFPHSVRASITGRGSSPSPARR